MRFVDEDCMRRDSLMKGLFLNDQTEEMILTPASRQKCERVFHVGEADAETQEAIWSCESLNFRTTGLVSIGLGVYP